MMQSRQVYQPKGSRRVSDKLSAAYAFLEERGGKFLAMGFYGKQSKASFYYSYGKEADRNKKVEIFFKGCQAMEQYKAEQKAAAKARNSNSGLKVGQVFVSSWGYDQTQVNYYEVVALIGAASAKVQAVKGESLEGSEGMMSQKVMPSAEANRFSGDAFMAKVERNRDGSFSIRSAKIAGRGGASAWEGKPNYNSWYA